MEKCLSIQVFSAELALKTGSENDPWGSNPVPFNIPLWQHSMLIHFTKWTGSKSFWHILNYEIAYWWYEYEQVFFRTVCKMALLEMLCAVTISAEHDGNICFLLRCFWAFLLDADPSHCGRKLHSVLCGNCDSQLFPWGEWNYDVLGNYFECCWLIKIASLSPYNIHQYLLLRGRAVHQSHSVGGFISIEKMVNKILLKTLAFIPKPLEPHNILHEWKNLC